MHTPHDTHDAPPIPHAHKPIKYPQTWLGELFRHAERLTDVRVPRGLIGLQPADEPICPRNWHDLIRAHASPETVDDAWRFLARQVVAQRGNWHLYAIGAMVPGLTGVALDIAPAATPRDVINQVYRDVIGQFLVAMQDMVGKPEVLEKPNVVGRLLGRAKYHAKTRFQPDPRHDEFDEQDVHTHRRAPRRPPGHPDFVLRAMIEYTKDLPDGYILTKDDAELIARSHMEYVGFWPQMRRKTIADAATELGMDVPGAGMRRWRAELLVARLSRAHAKGYKVPDAAVPPTPDEGPAGQSAA